MPNKPKRFLAAIMFTDIVGYTAMMQADEENAYGKRKRHKSILDSITEKHGGKILQYYGDGTMSMFGSAVEAVECAAEIQGELRKSPEIPLRIGIHIGDVAEEQDGIYGDGVNVASRIEHLCVGGGVLISDKVADEIKNHPGVRAINVGRFELKHVARPVDVFALDHPSVYVPAKTEISKRKIQAYKSVAVLPFANLSADPENEYFSDGITESIINCLAQTEGLKVTARTTSFTFKGRETDIREIGRELGVGTILEGSVRRAGNKIRITAQLINAGDGFHIFSETYDRDLENIFEIQDEISNKIANKLRENFLGPPYREFAGQHSVRNFEAYDFYLKGRFWMFSNNFNEGEKFYRKAIDLEPDFALPYTGLADYYLLLGSANIMDQEKAFTLARDNAEKAMQLNPVLAEAHVAFGRIYFWREWDIPQAETYFRKAISLSPGTAFNHGMYSMLLLADNRMEEALTEAEISYSLDPLSSIANYFLGMVYLNIKQERKAIRLFRKSIEIFPGFETANSYIALAYLYLGEADIAMETLKSIKIPPFRKAVFQGFLAIAYSMKGEMDKAAECLKRIDEMRGIEEIKFTDFAYALAYHALGEKEKVIEHLNKCLKQTVATLIFIRHFRFFDEYSDDPGYREILRKIFSKGSKDNRIKLQSDTKESLEINLNDLIFIEAKDNYSRFVWLESGSAKEKMLRMTLKNAEKQIGSDDFIRCHKSFIINTKQDFEISGDASGYRLKSPYCNTIISISRSKGKEIISRLD